jgi:hypothetical protein
LESAEALLREGKSNPAFRRTGLLPPSLFELWRTSRYRSQ